MTTWGDMAGSPMPDPTTVINQVAKAEIEWLFAMAELGIGANYFVSDANLARIRLQVLRESLGV